MSKISLFIFIDALGWEVLQAHQQFLRGIVVDKKKLRTILGYSSACDPSIISGQLPSEHLQWSSFYYTPQTSPPYKWVQWLRFLPSFLTNHHRFRSRMSQLIAWVHGFTGYFQIYQVPFAYLPYFDYAEKKWMWGTRNGLLHGKSIFDFLFHYQIPFYVKNSVGVSEEKQWNEAEQLIKEKKIHYAYLSLGKLDATMHEYGTQHKKVDKVLAEYDKKIRELIQLAKANYDQVSWYVFSDHGMHDVRNGFDLQSLIHQLGLTYGKDYLVLYDSTMARFWFMNKEAEKRIVDCLKGLKEGHILSTGDLKRLGIYFPDHRYGKIIFLMNPGVLIVPSFMGSKKIAGMHGYHPDDADSYAMICSNRLLPPDLSSIEQIFWIMIQDMESYTKLK